MKKSRIIALLFVIMILVSGCAKNTDNVKIDLGKSEIYSQEDLKSAAEVILKEIRSRKHIKQVYKISYCGDEYDASLIAGSLNKDYTQWVVFESSFKTSSSDKYEGFKPDSNYDGWEWCIARTDNGKWELKMDGYIDYKKAPK